MNWFRFTADIGFAQIDGGGGTDTVDFTRASTGLTLSLNLDGQLQDTGVGEFGLVEIENARGGAFADVITGSDDNNRILGLGGNDTIYGLDGFDNLQGGGGDDMIFGGADNDFLYGNNGNDTLNGGTGDDNLFGGNGSDVFVFEDVAGMGRDRVRDWTNNWDRLDLSDFGFADFAAVEALAADVGANMEITIAADQVIVLEGFQKADFDAGDVILV